MLTGLGKKYYTRRFGLPPVFLSLAIKSNTTSLVKPARTNDKTLSQNTFLPQYKLLFLSLSLSCNVYSLTGLLPFKPKCYTFHESCRDLGDLY